LLRGLSLLILNLVFLSSLSGQNLKDTNLIKSILKNSILLQRTDPDSALILASKAFNLSKKTNYKKGIGTAFMRIGSILHHKGKNDSALLYLKRSLTIRKDLKDYKAASGTCIVLSFVYDNLGITDSAFAVLYEALRLNLLSNDSIDLADTYVSLGNLEINYGNSNKALDYYKLAEGIALRQNNENGLSLALGGIGNYFFQIDDFTNALNYFLKKEAIDFKLNDQVLLSKTKMNIALCYEQLNETNKALSYYNQAINTYEKLNMKGDKALALFNIGSLYNNIKQADKAIPYFIEALKISRILNDKNRVLSCYEFLSDAYAIKSNYLKAYDYHLMYSALKDSLIKTEKINSISEMQTKYETEQKEAKIKLLNAQNKTKLAQRNFFIAGSIVLLLSIFVLVFYYIQKNKIAKKNELIAQQQISNLINEQEVKSYNAMIEGQEEERSRIATDLHDRLGSLLSTIKLLFNSLDSKIDLAQEENRNQYKKANELLDESVVEVRRISHNLSTGMVISFGLVTALQELTESINDSQLIKCKLLVYGMEERLEQKIEIGVYRIIQELINNILKHAKANKIIIQINKIESSINITVEDDGIGFDPKLKQKYSGMGLKNLEKRASQLNGSFHIDSQPGEGTISVIEIPILPNENN
jgi:two-component system, NarL family, sensor kinase